MDGKQLFVLQTSATAKDERVGRVSSARRFVNLRPNAKSPERYMFWVLGFGFRVAMVLCVLFFAPLQSWGQNTELADSIPKKQGNRTSEIIGIALPSAMITYGIISLGDNGIRKIDYNTQKSLERNNRFWHTRTDDFIQFAPAVAAYSMRLCNIESKHNLLDMTILYGLSNLLAGSVIQGTKMISGRERPDRSNKHSFPSGHTQTAFAAAEFLHQEYKDKSIWISIGGYSAATFVGVARVYNNRHWVSDIVAGAGIGILSTKAVYWAYPYLKKTHRKNEKTLETIILPGYNNGDLSLTFSHTF